MTLIMIWREGVSDRLWIVADSRLSKQGFGGDIRLTDRAAKVLEAQICLQGPNPNAPPLKARTMGFAYAGSTLIALQTYAAVLPLWPRLLSSTDQVLPTMKDCVEHLGVFLRAYGQELLASGADIGTECVLLGFDDAAGAVEAWHAKVAAVGPEADLRIEKLELGNGQRKLFGSGTRDAEESLKKINPTGRPWNREPLDMIREQLCESTAGTVGGGVQIGVAGLGGFQLYADARPFRVGVSCAGDSLLTMHYRGFDLDKVSKVGHTIATLPGFIG